MQHVWRSAANWKPSGGGGNRRRFRGGGWRHNVCGKMGEHRKGCIYVRTWDTHMFVQYMAQYRTNKMQAVLTRALISHSRFAFVFVAYIIDAFGHVLNRCLVGCLFTVWWLCLVVCVVSAQNVIERFKLGKSLFVWHLCADMCAAANAMLSGYWEIGWNFRFASIRMRAISPVHYILVVLWQASGWCDCVKNRFDFGFCRSFQSIPPPNLLLANFPFSSALHRCVVETVTRKDHTHGSAMRCRRISTQLHQTKEKKKKHKNDWV